MELPIKAQRQYIAEFDESMAESAHQISIDEDNRRFVPSYADIVARYGGLDSRRSVIILTD